MWVINERDSEAAETTSLTNPVHSLRHLRRSSTVLFSSVLAAAARFFRKDLHRRLLAHAQTILDRALTAGASDIGIVQSLMILTYWKSPADTSAWRKIGMAIRIGYQSFWHVPRAEPLPDDELAARHILNAERTWYCECLRPVLSGCMCPADLEHRSLL